MKNFFPQFQLDKNQYIILFLISALVIVSVNIVSYMNTKDLVEYRNSILPAVRYFETLETIKDNTGNAQYQRLVYLINEDKEALANYNKTALKIDTVYNKLKNSANLETFQKSSLDTLSALVKERFALLNRSLDLQSRKEKSIKLQKELIEQGKAIQDKIENQIVKMKDEELNFLRRDDHLHESKSEFTQYIAAIGTVTGIMLFGIIFYLLMKRGIAAGKLKPHQFTPEELEAIVRERTAEISKINNRLYKVIEKHEKTEAALKQSEKDLRDLFEQAHDAILIFDASNLKVLEVNKRACEVYGIKKEEFTGISVQTILKNIPENEEHIAKTLEKGYYYNFQTVHYRKNGSEILMEINASVINYRGTKAILSINRDITERILRLIPLPGS